MQRTTHNPMHARPPHAAITEALESTKGAAKDPAAIKSILEAASDRAMLKNAKPGEP